MNIYEFKALSEMEQIEAIWKVPAIAERHECGYKIFLFQIDSFYVELYHHLERDATERLRAFMHPDLLVPYLALINVDELIGPQPAGDP